MSDALTQSQVLILRSTQRNDLQPNAGGLPAGYRQDIELLLLMQLLQRHGGITTITDAGSAYLQLIEVDALGGPGGLRVGQLGSAIGESPKEPS